MLKSMKYSSIEIGPRSCKENCNTVFQEKGLTNSKGTDSLSHMTHPNINILLFHMDIHTFGLMQRSLSDVAGRRSCFDRRRPNIKSQLKQSREMNKNLRTHLLSLLQGERIQKYTFLGTEITRAGRLYILKDLAHYKLGMKHHNIYTGHSQMKLQVHIDSNCLDQQHSMMNRQDDSLRMWMKKCIGIVLLHKHTAYLSK